MHRPFPIIASILLAIMLLVASFPLPVSTTSVSSVAYSHHTFGNLLAQTGTTENNYLYTGEQYDANVGIYYLRARYYDTGVGRFISIDPWEGSIFDPQTLHKYLYAGADPIDNWDPSGMMTKEEELNYVAIMGRIGAITGLSFMAYMQMVNVGTIDYPDWDIDLDLHWEPFWEWNLLNYLSQQQTAISSGDFEDWTDEEWQEYYDYWQKRDMEECLLKWWKCYHNRWKGNCTDCFLNCVAQHGKWPKWMCPPGSFAGSVPWK